MKKGMKEIRKKKEKEIESKYPYYKFQGGLSTPPNILIRANNMYSDLNKENSKDVNIIMSLAIVARAYAVLEGRDNLKISLNILKDAFTKLNNLLDDNNKLNNEKFNHFTTLISDIGIVYAKLEDLAGYDYSGHIGETLIKHSEKMFNISLNLAKVSKNDPSSIVSKDAIDHLKTANNILNTSHKNFSDKCDNSLDEYPAVFIADIDTIIYKTWYDFPPHNNDNIIFKAWKNTIFEAWKNIPKINELLENGIVLYQKLHEGKHNVNSLYSLFSSYRNLGEYNLQKSIELLNESFNIMTKLNHGGPHPNIDMVKLLNNISSSYRLLGGEENAKKSLDIKKQALGMENNIKKIQHNFGGGKSLNNPNLEYTDYEVKVNTIFYSLGSTYEGFKDKVTKLLNNLDSLNQGFEETFYQFIYNENPLRSLFLNLIESYKSDNLQKILYLQEQVLQMLKQIYKEKNNLEALDLFYNLCRVYKILGGEESAKKSLELLEQALDMIRPLYNEKPLFDITGLLTSIGRIYGFLGINNIKKSLELQEQEVKMMRELYHEKPHPSMVSSLNNLAMVYKNLGGEENAKKSLDRQEEALKLQEKEIDILKQCHDKKPHLDVVNLLNNLAMVYKNLGGGENLKKSIDLEEQSLEMTRELHNRKPNFDVITLLNKLSLKYKNFGGQENLKKALNLQEEELGMLRDLYNRKPHPHVAMSLNNISLTYKDLGGEKNLKKSLELLNESNDMLTTFYNGQKHISMIEILNNIILIYKDLGTQKQNNLEENPEPQMQNNLEKKPEIQDIKSLKRKASYQSYQSDEEVHKKIKLNEDQSNKKINKPTIINPSEVSNFVNDVNNNISGYGMAVGAKLEYKQLQEQKQKDMPMYKWFAKYYAEGMNNLLELRSKDLKHVVSLPFMQMKDGTEQMAQVVDIIEDTMRNGEFNKIVAQAFDKAATVLIPLNLYGKHWVGLGLSFDKSDNTLQVTYIDPENRAIPAELQHYIEVMFPLYAKIIVLQRFVEAQKYKNCGPQVIEELVAFAAEREGKAHTKIPQEEVIPVHSMLLENSLLSQTYKEQKIDKIFDKMFSINKMSLDILPNSENTKYYKERDNGLYKLVMKNKFSVTKSKEMLLDQNQSSYLILDDKALAQLKHYTKTGILLPRAQAALEHGAQITILHNIIDVHHTRTAIFTERHYMDEKIIAQTLHYIEGGEMFDTLRHAVVANVVHFEEATYTTERQVEEEMYQFQEIIPIDPQANIQIDEESAAAINNNQQYYLILNLFTFIKNTLQEQYAIYFIES